MTVASVLFQPGGGCQATPSPFSRTPCGMNYVISRQFTKQPTNRPWFQILLCNNTHKKGRENTQTEPDGT